MGIDGTLHFKLQLSIPLFLLSAFKNHKCNSLRNLKNGCCHMERCPFDGRSALVFYRTLDRSPSSTFGFWVARFLRVFACRTGCLSRNSSIVIRSFASGNVRKEGSSGLRRYPIMDGLVEKKAEAEERRGMSESNGSDEFREGGSSCESSTTYCGTSEEQSCSEESLPIGWPIGKAEARSGSVGLGAGEKAETRASSEKREKTDEKFSGNVVLPFF